MATKKKTSDVPQHFKDATEKLRQAGQFNVGTKLYKSNPKHQK